MAKKTDPSQGSEGSPAKPGAQGKKRQPQPPRRPARRKPATKPERKPRESDDERRTRMAAEVHNYIKTRSVADRFELLDFFKKLLGKEDQDQE